MTRQKKCGSIHNCDLLLMSLSNFFSDSSHMAKLLEFVSNASDSSISLRMIDWFVTNYAKRHLVVIDKTNIYTSYRAQLKAYSKQLFDPFRRRDRIAFFYDKDNSLETTIGQLNFFRWAIQTHVLDYIQTHAESLDKDMTAFNTTKLVATEDPDVEIPPAAAASSEPKKQTKQPMVHLTDDIDVRPSSRACVLGGGNEPPPLSVHHNNMSNNLSIFNKVTIMRSPDHRIVFD